jgi:hypothetical protein
VVIGSRITVLLGAEADRNDSAIAVSNLRLADASR